MQCVIIIVLCVCVSLCWLSLVDDIILFVFIFVIFNKFTNLKKNYPPIILN